MFVSKIGNIKNKINLYNRTKEKHHIFVLFISAEQFVWRTRRSERAGKNPLQMIFIFEIEWIRWCALLLKSLKKWINRRNELSHYIPKRWFPSVLCVQCVYFWHLANRSILNKNLINIIAVWMREPSRIVCATEK